MLKEMHFSQVYLVCGYTDMRRGIDGLSAIVQQNYGLEPCLGSLFLFCGRRRDRLKALLWEDDGFLLMYKRLDNGGFQWPRSESEARLGSMEGNIFTLIGNRMKGRRACWSVDGGNNLAALLCKHYSVSRSDNTEYPAVDYSMNSPLSAAKVCETEGKGYEFAGNISIPSRLKWLKQLSI